MPYTFRDTDSAANNYVLPSEALKINGEYVEELFAEDLTLGATYQTLSVQGRELSAQEAADIEVGVRHGSFLSSRRFKPRELHITYKLEASSNEYFRQAFNKLNEILNVQDAQLIFADEPDKFFIGTVTEVDEIEPGRNAVVSEFVITCFDPFKYSVEEYEAEPNEDGEIIINYKGTVPAYPVLEADFYESETENDSNGDCGFVAFMNDRGAVLQFGDPEELDDRAEKVKKITSQTSVSTTTSRKSTLLVNEPFNALGDWRANQGFNSNSYPQVGSPVCSFFPSGDNKVLQAGSYGSTSLSQWHGPSATLTIPNNTGGARSPNCSFKAQIRFCAIYTAPTAQGIMVPTIAFSGALQCFLLESNGSYLCGFAIFKSKGSLDGVIRCYLRNHGVVKEWTGISVDWYSKYFGFSQNPKPNLYASITKTGGTFSFNIGGLSFSFTDNAFANTVVGKICFDFLQWANHPVTLGRIGVYDCQFTDTNMAYTVSTSTTTENITWLTNWVDQKNKFGTNDVLVADCSNGDIRIKSAKDAGASGLERADLGALGNQWEEFTLVPGTNQIGFSFSDWVTEEHAPTYKMRYREVFV